MRQLQFHVTKEEEETSAHIEFFLVNTSTFNAIEWEDYRLEDELYQAQCRREQERDNSFDSFDC